MTLADSTVVTLSDVWILDGMVTGQAGTKMVGIPVESVARAEAGKVNLLPVAYAVVVVTWATISIVYLANKPEPLNRYGN